MIFDTRFTWKDHVAYIKAECLKRLNLLRCVSGTSWGASKKSLPLNLQRKSLQLKYISKVYIEKDHPNASLLEKDWQYYYGKFKSNNVPLARKVK